MLQTMCMCMCRATRAQTRQRQRQRQTGDKHQGNHSKKIIRRRRRSIWKNHQGKRECEEKQQQNKEDKRGRRTTILSGSVSSAMMLAAGMDGRRGSVSRAAGVAERRERLLSLIASSSTSYDVSSAISDLVSNTNTNTNTFDSLGGVTTTETDAEAFSRLLQGKWKLLWSSDGAEVSRFTRFLPNVFTSYQLIGEPAGLPKDRAMNVIDALGGSVQLRLSSSARMSPERFSTIVIGPPFVFELNIGGLVIPLGQESTVGSDESPLLGSQVNVRCNSMHARSSSNNNNDTHRDVIIIIIMSTLEWKRLD